MTIQEIFNSPPVKALEIEILSTENGHKTYDRLAAETEVELVKRLLGIRRDLLNRMFVMTDEYKALLAEFNESLSKAIVQAAHMAETVYRHDWGRMKDDVRICTKCFLGYKYSSNHPIQTIRAKKMWSILAGCIDDYDVMYTDGIVYGGIEACGRGESFDDKQTNKLLYDSETLDNWNDGLDVEKTKDMHITYHFHHLFDHCLFSIFDLLWVREFNFETHAEYDSCTLEDEETDDLDWEKFDYYD